MAHGWYRRKLPQRLSCGGVPERGLHERRRRDAAQHLYTVAELVNLTPVGISFNMVDASAHDGSGWGTSIPTFKRGVDMRVEINLVPAHPTHDETTGMIGLALGKIRRDWLVVLPDAGRSAMAFQAFISDHCTVTPFDGVLRATPVFSIDGKMDWANA